MGYTSNLCKRLNPFRLCILYMTLNQHEKKKREKYPSVRVCVRALYTLRAYTNGTIQEDKRRKILIQRSTTLLR